MLFAFALVLSLYFFTALAGSCNPKPGNIMGGCNDDVSNISALLQQLLSSGNTLAFRITAPPNAQTTEADSNVLIKGHVVVEVVPSGSSNSNVVGEPTKAPAPMDDSKNGVENVDGATDAIEDSASHVVVESARGSSGMSGEGNAVRGARFVRNVVPRANRMGRRYRM